MRVNNIILRILIILSYLRPYNKQCHFVKKYELIISIFITPGTVTGFPQVVVCNNGNSKRFSTRKTKAMSRQSNQAQLVRSIKKVQQSNEQSNRIKTRTFSQLCVTKKAKQRAIKQTKAYLVHLVNSVKIKMVEYEMKSKQ